MESVKHAPSLSLPHTHTHTGSLSIPLETLCFHIAISCSSLIWSNLELHSSKASRSSLCSPAAPPSLFLFLSFSLLPSFYHSDTLLVCNVMIGMQGKGKAFVGHQSLRRSVSCLAVSQSADQSFSSLSCWITHPIALLITQLLNHLLLLFFTFYNVYTSIRTIKVCGK